MFVGENGFMQELPLAKDLMESDYEKIRNAQYVG